MSQQNGFVDTVVKWGLVAKTITPPIAKKILPVLGMVASFLYLSPITGWIATGIGSAIGYGGGITINQFFKDESRSGWKTFGLAVGLIVSPMAVMSTPSIERMLVAAQSNPHASGVHAGVGLGNAGKFIMGVVDGIRNGEAAAETKETTQQSSPQQQQPPSEPDTSESGSLPKAGLTCTTKKDVKAVPVETLMGKATGPAVVLPPGAKATVGEIVTLTLPGGERVQQSVILLKDPKKPKIPHRAYAGTKFSMESCSW